MAIVGDHPETGVRFVLERPREGGAPWIYKGHAFTPEARFALEVHVSGDGDVAVAGGDELPPDLAEKVRLLFRTLYKQARQPSDTPGGAPPMKVVRWRGEK